MKISIWKLEIIYFVLYFPPSGTFNIYLSTSYMSHLHFTAVKFSS